MRHTPDAKRGVRTLRGMWAACVVACSPAVALAHHGMDGKTPATFVDGLLSGLAHPIIGVDHLAMILLIGAYCGVTRHGLTPLVAFVSAGLLACLGHAARWDLPHVETGIAASLVLMGVVGCTLARPKRFAVVGALAVFGVLHGYAYGESIVGAESTPLGAYLLGLAIVQVVLGAIAWRVARPAAEQGVEASRLALVRVLAIGSAAIGVAAMT